VALAMIDGNTPVKSDTQVGLEFQGLTGIAAISFTGGSDEAPPPPKLCVSRNGRGHGPAEIGENGFEVARHAGHRSAPWRRERKVERARETRVRAAPSLMSRRRATSA